MQPSIGKLIDEAMIAIEKSNDGLKKADPPKDYARPALNSIMLGELINLIAGIALGQKKGDGFSESLRAVREWATRRRRSEGVAAVGLDRAPSARTGWHA